MLREHRESENEMVNEILAGRNPNSPDKVSITSFLSHENLLRMQDESR